MSSCCDRCWCSQSPLHLPVKLAEVILGPVQAVCAEAQCNRRTVLHLSRPRGEDFSSADLFLRAEPKPGCESRGIAESRNVWPNLHKDGVRSDRADAGNIRQVYACDSKQLSLQIKCRFVACTLIDTCLSPRRHLLRRSGGAGKVSHAAFKFLVDFKEELLIEAITNKGLPQRK